MGISSSRRVFHRSPSRPCRPSWTERTFVKSDEAEHDLCTDRPRFLSRHDIIKVIPKNIMKLINHPEPTAQITGFQELFVHLNRQNTEELRLLVVEYFRESPVLRGNLSE